MIPKEPLFSIITCTFNCRSEIQSTINSVASQSFPDLEHIIIDGSSTDGTKEWLISAAKVGLFNHFLTERDHGIYDALNKGIRACKGEFVVVLHAGTALEPGALETLANIIRNNGSDHIIASSVVWQKHKDSRTYELRSSLKPLSCRNTKILHESIFIPRKFFGTIGLYDCRYSISADYEWICRAESKNMLTPIYSDEVLICYESGWGISGEPKNELKKITEHYKIARQYVGLPFALRRYVFRLTKLAIKRLISYVRS